MPPTTEYSAKCDRLNALRADMGKIVDEWDAAHKEGKLSPEKAKELKARFDKLADEFRPLKEEVLSADTGTKLKQVLREFDDCLENPRPAPVREAPEGVGGGFEQLAKNFLANRGRGRQGLRYFRPYGDSLAARPHNEQAALHAGLVFMARASSGASREWAVARLQAHGITGEKLAQISPYMGEDGQAAGGYLVFPEFEATLINLKEQYGVVQQLAYKVPMTSDTLLIPRRAGGTTVYYPGENTQISASAMKFDQVQLIAKKYAQLALWASELNEDSVIAFTDLLASEMAYQFAKAEDFNAAQGDGTSNYAGVVGFLQALTLGKNGIVPSASVVSVASGSGYTTPAAWLAGQTTAQILAVWNQVVGTLPVYAEGRARWLAHKTLFWGLIAPVVEAAGGNIAMYLTSGLPLRFLGYDFTPMQAMPTLSQINGTSATYPLRMAAVLGDVQNTIFCGQRRGVTTKTSDQRFIEFDQLAIQTTQRVAINNVVGDSVEPTVQAGPMVGLQFPAT
jgi:HK97 family phage major capsid protein